MAKDPMSVRHGEREIRYSDPVLEAILAELKAIRAAVEHPKQTVERERIELLKSLG